ncbi:MAG: vitamin B12 dependent-methionine synthase activation domain-containing protein, partial [Gammaproteobacteria bacterium]|nr:vitamin B12 dependent-methionine synthase activation domain-containing protein [Gammaproteobacteria bacterium]
LQSAKDEAIDIIGLSGLITPSLDEMVHVASEMQRQRLDIPLLIGGATTSKAHTAVKIEQNYRNGATIYVPDASRSVSVVSKLLNPDHKSVYCQTIRDEYEIIRERTIKRNSHRNLLAFSVANEKKLDAGWKSFQPVKPSFEGTRVFEDYPLEELVPFIDWTPFFISWSLAGKYPSVLKDEKVGEAARELFTDAQAMLNKIITEKLLTARAVIGFWPARRHGDNDVQLYHSNGSNQPLATMHFLRQQLCKDTELANLSLADFIAPEECTQHDYIGGFVVTAGIGAQQLAAHYEAEHNDYSALLVKALADRLAEAFAERMHQRVRKEFWAYQPDEGLSNEELIKEHYQGIRPAPGYPACPDHSEKSTLFSLLDAEQQIGVELTESFAMTPAASVSGYYFAHPQARYFSVGKISEDQVNDLASRKGLKSKQVSRLLSANLAEA